MKNSHRLAELLNAPEILVVPGVFDAFAMLFAEAAGFSAVYLSGASLAYMQYGKPDVGLLSTTDVVAGLTRVSEPVDLPVIVDADTGFGNVLNVIQTVKRLERAGAAAIQIEDQVSPKRCGHLVGKTLIDSDEMIGKIRAAVDARSPTGPLIIARTDAIAVEGLGPAIERARRYAGAGADALFVEGPQDQEMLATIGRELGQTAPLMANMVEGGVTPLLSSDELQAMGYSLVIFPGSLARAYGFAAQALFGTLRRDGTTAAFRDRMMDFTQLNQFLKTEAFLALGQKYENATE